MSSKEMNTKRRNTGLMVGGLLLAGAVGTVAWGATPTATAEKGTPPCGRHGDIDLAKMNERAVKIFAAADTNGDGKITMVEFLAFKPDKGMRGPGMGAPGMGMRMGQGGGPRPTAKEHDAKVQAFEAEVFKELDTDHNGQLSAEEFSKAHEVVRTVMAQQMFAKLDKNGDGVLTKDEFPPFVQKMAALDTNGDGTVSRDEMKAAHPGKGAQNGPPSN